MNDSSDALALDALSGSVMPARQDIRDRSDLETLVTDFYARVRKDDLLGFIFDEIARVDWSSHLPKIVDFWETALFRSGAYRGNPLQPHLRLDGQVAMNEERFGRWLALFFATVDTHFAGDRAEHLKRIAADMAHVMLRRIRSEVPDSRD
ncbi:MAG: group III truncated hemoglobin [Verrucomicrobiae bacterium]|nr:group III truncated hemoglobin [Verrucomicrobiae bacterium]MCB1089918.1 group III truncated hemoglobin [Verrucomicrobiae bacterium]